MSDLDSILDQLADKIASRLSGFRTDRPEPVSTRPLLTTQDLAAKLNLHEHTVRRWVVKGCPHEALPGEGTRYRFDLDHVMAWLKARRAA